MYCDKVLGKATDPQFAGLHVDHVDIEWHEAFSRLHRKKSYDGEDVGIHMGNEVLSKGLNQDDVIYADGEKILAVNIPPCEAICARVSKDHPQQIAKLCYEVGNTHTTMFRGEDDYTFYTPYYDSLFLKLSNIHGVNLEKVTMRFDFSKALSSSISGHHH